MSPWGSQQQSAFSAAGEGEMRGSVICPKPRRLATGAKPVRPLQFNAWHHTEPSDSEAGAELLDIFLTEGREQSQVDPSPPFFSGSPPSRASNPLIYDARFGEEEPVQPLPAPLLGLPVITAAPSASASSRKGCGPAKFGLKPAAMRIEGFDCLNRSRRSCGIPAFA